jgi:TonB family protein
MKALARLAIVVAALSCSHTYAAPSSRENALEVVYMTNPYFPPSLLHRGVTRGETEAIVSFGTNGRPDDWLVTAYTDPALERMTDDLLRSLECRLPSSAAKDGPTRVTLQFSFESQGAVVSLTVNDTVDSLMTRITGLRRIDKMGTSRQLDHALTARHTVAPLFPEAAQNETGSSVTLEFLIDETGRVRMPVLHAGENRALANAAAHALMDWQFAPPTRAGRPVIVAARQEFILPPRP